MATLQTTTAESPAGGEPNKYLRRDLIFIAYAALITTLSQTQVLGDLPIRKQLMNFGADETAVSLFIFWSGLAWYLKPAFGLVIDAFPLLGTRRRWYMISAAALAALSWGLAGYSPRWCQPGHYGPFLTGTILLGTFMVVASTIMGALLVEVGQRYQATGRVSAVREVVQNSCLIIMAPISGWLADRVFGLTAGIGAGLLVSLAVAAYLWLPEKPVAKQDMQVWKKAGQQLKLIFGSGTLWAAAGLLTLYFFSPGFATPLQFRQNNLLGFTMEDVGWVRMVGAIFMVLGGVLYGLVCRRFPLRTMLMAGIVISGAGALLYLNYHPTFMQALGIEAIYNFFYGLGVLPLYDLATRATPRGGEAMGYALMMSARNLALFGADVVGSKFKNLDLGVTVLGWWNDHFHTRWVVNPGANDITWNMLVLLNAGTTLLCLLAVPFLPKILMRHREGENLGEPGVTGEQFGAIEPAPERS